MNNLRKYTFFLPYILILGGALYHASFLHLNEILKVADSFSYIRMAEGLQNISLYEGLGNGWFGFLYSAPIAFIGLFFSDTFIAAQFTNILLFMFSSLLFYLFAKQFLSPIFSLLALLCFILSPQLLHFNIHVLSENIYIPLFLGLLLVSSRILRIASKENPLGFKDAFGYGAFAGLLIGCMYLTRADALMYSLSFGALGMILLLQRRISLPSFFVCASSFTIACLICVIPYVFYLHSFTGEWELTNKGPSNLRQAQMRSTEKMDDVGFERAVAQLVPNKTKLIAGFAGGMPYQKPEIDATLGSYISEDPLAFVYRIGTNYQKVFTQNLPLLFLGDSPKLFFSEDARFQNIFFLVFCIIPLLVIIRGIAVSYSQHRSLFTITALYFAPALVFFTLFFTLNRYFLIFLPLLFIFLVIGIQSIPRVSFRSLFLANYLAIIILSTSVYYNTESEKDDYYALKKEAGLWLRGEIEKGISGIYTGCYHAIREPKILNPKIIERFPIVTYYSGAKDRYITPYTNKISHVYEFGSFRRMDILVVDTMDFQTYRPELARHYLDRVPANFQKIEEFSNDRGQRVILYALKY